jgi:hypothetical protein
MIVYIYIDRVNYCFKPLPSCTTVVNISIFIFIFILFGENNCTIDSWFWEEYYKGSYTFCYDFVRKLCEYSHDTKYSLAMEIMKAYVVKYM